MNRLTQSEKESLKQLLRLECTFTLSDEVMDALLDTGVTRRLARGEAIIKAGDIDGNIYFIIDGIARHWYWNGNREKTAFFSQAGTMLISYHPYYFGRGSFLKNRPEILNQVQLKVIASYLDVTPQYLSKLRKMEL